MPKVCETAFFAATESGADVFVPKGAIFPSDHPLTVGRDALFVDTDDIEAPGAVQLNAPDGTPGFPRVEDDGTVTLGPGTTLDPVVGVVAHAGETYYTIDRAAEVLLELEAILTPTVESAGDSSSSSDASSDAGTTPPAPAAPVAKKAAAKKAAQRPPRS